MQSHSAADFINCTTSASAVTAKNTDSFTASFGKWEATAAGSLVEPLQIHLPVTPTITSFSTTAAIKSENISSGSASSSCSTSSKTPTSTSKRSSKSSKQANKNINDCILNLHQHHQTKSETTTGSKSSDTGCSRTLPLAWNTAVHHVNNNVNCDIPTSSATLLQIKREPCQVSEVTTSNNLLSTTSFTSHPQAIIKIEQKSPTTTTTTATNLTTSSMETMANNFGLQQNNGENSRQGFHDVFYTLENHLAGASAAIPIGIAVGRQRLQETITNSSTPQLLHKDLNRFSLGLADLGEFLFLKYLSFQ